MLKTAGFVMLVLSGVLPASEGRGVLLLYRPHDVTNDCAISENLRYDLSFGMGLSDTITLVMRTISEVDYECEIDITTEQITGVALLIVIRFPNSIKINCLQNPYAFTILKKKECIQLCEQLTLKDYSTPYFSIALSSKFRFRFVSNSSINTDMQAYLYEVTATTARLTLTAAGCLRMNETFCKMDANSYCFTSGVMCDGIKNCGVPDWYDERKADCGMPVEKLGNSTVIAVAAALICVALAAAHITIKCLPPAANSYFIFNINEDNRLFIEPVFRNPSGPLPEIEIVKKNSLVPVDYSSPSSNSTVDNNGLEQHIAARLASEEISPFPKRKNTVKAVTRQLQEKIKIVTTKIRNTMESDNDANTSSLTKSVEHDIKSSL